MEYLAHATGGRAFSGGKVNAMEWRDVGGRSGGGWYGLPTDHGVISDAIRFAGDDSRYAYEMGFYVPESELDGKVHTLRVTVPPNQSSTCVSPWIHGVRQHDRAAAAQDLTEPASTLNSDRLQSRKP